MRKLILLIVFIMSTYKIEGQNSLQIVTSGNDLEYIEAPSIYFSGKAKFAIFPRISNSADSYAIVHFEKDAITNWHTHSYGQYLIVTEGEGLTQEWGKPIKTIKKGDIVWCPPNVKHWHGAASTNSMSHIVISPNAENNKVQWLERVNLSEVEKTSDSVIQKESLKDRQLSIIPIASWAAVGNMEKLRFVLVEGLEKGLTINEIKEVFVHLQAYAGFPRALNALMTFNNLLKERSEKGINDIIGKEANIISSPNYYQLGEEILRKIGSGRIITSEPLFDSKGMDYALKANLFGYLFSRDNFSYVDRELVAISVISTLEGAESQLSSHIKIISHLGIDKSGLNKIIDKVKSIDKRNSDRIERVVKNGF